MPIYEIIKCKSESKFIELHFIVHSIYFVFYFIFED